MRIFSPPFVHSFFLNFGKTQHFEICTVLQDEADGVLRHKTVVDDENLQSGSARTLQNHLQCYDKIKTIFDYDYFHFIILNLVEHSVG